MVSQNGLGISVLPGSRSSFGGGGECRCQFGFTRRPVSFRHECRLFNGSTRKFFILVKVGICMCNSQEVIKVKYHIDKFRESSGFINV